MHHTARPGGHWLACFLSVLLVLSLSGCDDDSPTCPAQEIGQVEGYVRAAGEGVSVPVGARALSGDRRGYLIATTTAESNGFFRLDVPAGEFRLEVNPADGRVLSSDATDTIHYSPPYRRHDLNRGSGRVLLDLPEELEGETVRLRLAGDFLSNPSEAVVVTGGQAVFEFPILRAIPHDMNFALPGECSLYLPAGATSEEGIPLAVGTDTVATYHQDLRPQFASIAGTVQGSFAQDAVGTMRVALYNLEGRTNCSVYCDATGGYRCRTFLPGPVVLGSSWSVIDQWYGGDSLEDATVFDLEAGQHLEGVDLVENGLTLHLSGPGPMFIYNPDWILRSDDGREYELSGYPSSGTQVRNLPDGRYYLQVTGTCNGQTWAPQWYGGAEDFEEAMPIDLVGGQLDDLTLNLVEGGRIEGGLRDADGGPIDEVSYRLLNLDGTYVCNSWDSWFGPDIHYTGLANGKYLIAALDDAVGVWFYPGTGNIEEAGVIEISGFGAVEDVVWNLPATRREEIR